MQHKSGKQISLRSLRRYGKEEAGVELKRTKKRTAQESKSTQTGQTELAIAHAYSASWKLYACDCDCRSVSPSLCDLIARQRRKLQRMDKDRVVFLDETAMRVSEAQTSTLALPGEDAVVVVEDTSAYARRYDMIAACNGSRTFPPIIFSPSDRTERGVKGINRKMLEQYIQSVLAQQLEALDLYPLTLVLDRASIHARDLLQEFEDMSCGCVTEILFMPPQGAKRMSPLDNSLFHDWKEAVRKRGPISAANIQQLMNDEWANISAEKIRAQYRHSLLMREQDPYADCPAPAEHEHEK